MKQITFLLILFTLALSACNAGSPPSPTIEVTHLTPKATSTNSPTVTPTLTPLPTQTLTPAMPTFEESSNFVYYTEVVLFQTDHSGWKLTTWDYSMKPITSYGAQNVIYWNQKHSRYDIFTAPEGVYKFYIKPATAIAGDRHHLMYCLDSGNCIWKDAKEAVAYDHKTSLQGAEQFWVNQWIELAKKQQLCLVRRKMASDPLPCVRFYTATPQD